MILYDRVKTLIKYSKTTGTIILFIGIVIKSLIEVIGVASITPFVSVMVNPDIVQKSRAVEVDIKKEIAIGKADMSIIKSEEVKGKVNNKLYKLKKLRRRNGR